MDMPKRFGVETYAVFSRSRRAVDSKVEGKIRVSSMASANGKWADFGGGDGGEAEIRALRDASSVQVALIFINHLPRQGTKVCRGVANGCCELRPTIDLCDVSTLWKLFGTKSRLIVQMAHLRIPPTPRLLSRRLYLLVVSYLFEEGTVWAPWCLERHGIANYCVGFQTVHLVQITQEVYRGHGEVK